ncbi:MAG: hypothetical protein JOZ40_22750, partial [Methylobacteriaceae bacterium]|nr:hypothetical protein [Methylobacteriaceae bacterium]
MSGNKPAGQDMRFASPSKDGGKPAACTAARYAATSRLTRIDPALPPAQGLYDPAKQHDSCGVAFIADMHNRTSHDIIVKGLEILRNLDHRGAVGADPKLGDGCGILVQIPHAFFLEECARIGISLPGPREYAVGQ